LYAFGCFLEQFSSWRGYISIRQGTLREVAALRDLRGHLPPLLLEIKLWLKFLCTRPLELFNPEQFYLFAPDQFRHYPGNSNFLLRAVIGLLCGRAQLPISPPLGNVVGRFFVFFFFLILWSRGDSKAVRSTVQLTNTISHRVGGFIRPELFPSGIGHGGNWRPTNGLGAFI